MITEVSTHGGITRRKRGKLISISVVRPRDSRRKGPEPILKNSAEGGKVWGGKIRTDSDPITRHYI